MNIYIGNLNYEVTEAELLSILEEFGAIKSVKLITDKFTGKSKGFGFIEVEDKAEAENTIQSLNGRMLHGRPMVVKESLPKTY